MAERTPLKVSGAAGCMPRSLNVARVLRMPGQTDHRAAVNLRAAHRGVATPTRARGAAQGHHAVAGQQQAALTARAAVRSKHH